MVFHHFLAEQEYLQTVGPKSNYKRAHNNAVSEGEKVFGYSYKEIYKDDNSLDYIQFYNSEGMELFKVKAYSDGDNPMKYEVIDGN